VGIKTSVRLVRIVVVVATMSPLIAERNHNPALISLQGESLGTLEVSESLVTSRRFRARFLGSDS